MLKMCATNLEQGHVATVGHQVRRDDLGNLGPVSLPRRCVFGIVIAQFPIFSRGQPKWKATSIGLGIDVGSGSDEKVQADLLGEGHDTCEVVGAGVEVENAGGRLVKAPAVVNREGVEADGVSVHQSPCR